MFQILVVIPTSLELDFRGFQASYHNDSKRRVRVALSVFFGGSRARRLSKPLVGLSIGRSVRPSQSCFKGIFIVSRVFPTILRSFKTFLFVCLFICVSDAPDVGLMILFKFSVPLVCFNVSVYVI